LGAVDPSETDHGESIQIFKQLWFGKSMSASVIALNHLQQPSHPEFDESSGEVIGQPPDQDNIGNNDLNTHRRCTTVLRRPFDVQARM